MALSLYVAGQSWLHRLDPMTKLQLALIALLLTFLLNGPVANGALFLLSLLLLSTAGVLRRGLAVLVGVSFIALTFFVVQGLVYPGNQMLAFRLGPLHFYQEGLLLGLRLALRLYNILAATLLLLLTTRPSDLVDSLVRRGLPTRFGYVMIAVLQIIPTMTAATQSIMDAQRSRGMELDGSLWRRLRAFLPLMGPLVTSSLIATEERALALEVRGFSGQGRPSFLHEEQIPPYAGLVRLLALVALALGIGGRWLFRWP